MSLPRIELLRMPPVWYAQPILFRIEHEGRVFEQDVLYSQLTLFKLLTDYGRDFDSVLDIGSHWGNVANVFKSLGKRVTTCEVMPGCEADYKADYLTIDFPEKFDAIWCSQVLEHQRNVGFFLNKIFDDLNDGGILALTVPVQTDMNLSFGHCNLFSPLIVIYHLVSAGFCCRDIKLKLYDGNIGVVLRKRYNGIRRDLPMGSLPATDKTDGEVTIKGRQWNVREMLGDEVFDGMTAAFPEGYPESITSPAVDAPPAQIALAPDAAPAPEPAPDTAPPLAKPPRPTLLRRLFG
jgi:SAM-dependent methyltransferase